MNVIILTGRITKDLELRETTSGTKVLQFNIAVQRDYKNKDGIYDADFINCQAFNKTAEMISKYFKKGSRIGVQGKLQNNNYEKDGVMIYRDLVNVLTVEFLDNKNSSNDSDNSKEEEYQSTSNKLVSEEDLPF